MSELEKTFELNQRKYEVVETNRFPFGTGKPLKVMMTNEKGIHVLYFEKYVTKEKIESCFKEQLGENF